MFVKKLVITGKFNGKPVILTWEPKWEPLSAGGMMFNPFDSLQGPEDVCREIVGQAVDSDGVQLGYGPNRSKTMMRHLANYDAIQVFASRVLTDVKVEQIRSAPDTLPFDLQIRDLLDG